ncbi:hypothetical protein MFRU_007g02150 [Monilinia fructicola]|nr:hypothetical protein MFRU_007g02150 [Monilinia fructicola]
MSETMSDDDKYKTGCSEFDKGAKGLSEALKENIEVLQKHRETNERRIKALGEFQKRVDDWRNKFKGKTEETRDGIILDTADGGQDQAAKRSY